MPPLFAHMIERLARRAARTAPASRHAVVPRLVYQRAAASDAPEMARLLLLGGLSGIPISTTSTTHAITSAILGVGAARRLSVVRCAAASMTGQREHLRAVIKLDDKP